MVLPNAEAKVLRWLNKATCERAVSMIGHLYPGELLMNVARRIETKPLEKIEDVVALFTTQGYSHDFSVAMAEELVDTAYEAVALVHAEKTEERLAKFERKTANRAKYVPEPVFKFYEVENQDMKRWQFDRDLRSFGLDIRSVMLLSTPLYSNTTLQPLLATLAAGGLTILMPKFNEHIDELDAFYQSSFEEGEMQPPADMWDRIEASYDKQKEKTKPKPFYTKRNFWLMVGAVILLLLLMLFFNSSSEKGIIFSILEFDFAYLLAK